MKRDAIFSALDEVKRFGNAVTAWNVADSALSAAHDRAQANSPREYHYRGDANVEHAALKRASMDLTRALAKMRAS